MAQLIKIENYISRYEKDIFHYPGQFMRLKKVNYSKFEQAWENQANNKSEVFSAKQKIKHIFSANDKTQTEDDLSDDTSKTTSVKELKQSFLDHLMPFQLKWASTTIGEMSFIDRYYYEDFKLKYFLQRIPDIYLLFYYPVFQLKQTSLDGEILLVSPVEIEIIKFVEMDSTMMIYPSEDRTWRLEKDSVQSTMLSPMISLNRTEQIVRSILKKYKLDFPIKKIVLSRTNSILVHNEPYNTRFIGKDQHEKWLHEKRSFVSPLKHAQLKVCEFLLKHCQTNAVRRPEWDQEVNGDQLY
ncbi:NERD domain-containing protein [Aquibacillus albus]|uniref:NERD domain-containing protein n=1 Tax=Aquibacillus albus TaxID=1168171 RepID=A0ABS2N3X0_9BACI|nr:NERD domain-containing protein [Aquibacillus albus]MBM7572822.1 hypothetical protein [Aquibacillus albus]